MSENILDSWMTPICPTCRREDPTVKAWCCSECFGEWYDGSIDHRTPDGDYIDSRSIGNYVRKKHGLPPLNTTQGSDKRKE